MLKLGYLLAIRPDVAGRLRELLFMQQALMTIFLGNFQRRRWRSTMRFMFMLFGFLNNALTPVSRAFWTRERSDIWWQAVVLETAFTAVVKRSHVPFRGICVGAPFQVRLLTPP